MANDNFRELTVYKKAFSLSMELFHLSKKFPGKIRFNIPGQKKLKVCVLKHRRRLQKKAIPRSFCKQSK